MKRTASFGLSSIACALFALAGCGGGGGSAPGSSTIPTGNLRTSAMFSISVQLPSASSSAVAPKYISPNTQSMVITLLSVNGAAPNPPQAPVTANITPSSPGCSTSGSTLTCNVAVASIVGSDTYQLTAFSAVNAGGNQLSSGTTTATITAGILNNVPVTLNGIIASLAVNLGTTSPSTGTASVIPVTVTAKDASGATIVGPGNYNYR